MIPPKIPISITMIIQHIRRYVNIWRRCNMHKYRKTVPHIFSVLQSCYLCDSELDCQPKIVQKLFSQRESLKLNRS